MKTTYFLLGHEGIETLEEFGLDELIQQIQERSNVYNEIICDVVCFNRNSDPEELMETICGYTEYIQIDKEMYDKINGSLHGEYN